MRYVLMLVTSLPVSAYVSEAEKAASQINANEQIQAYVKAQNDKQNLEDLEWQARGNM